MGCLLHLWQQIAQTWFFKFLLLWKLDNIPSTGRKVNLNSPLRERECSPNKLALWQFDVDIIYSTTQHNNKTNPAIWWHHRHRPFKDQPCHKQSYGTYKYTSMWGPQHRRLMKRGNRMEKIFLILFLEFGK